MAYLELWGNLSYFCNISSLYIKSICNTCPHFVNFIVFSPSFRFLLCHLNQVIKEYTTNNIHHIKDETFYKIMQCYHILCFTLRTVKITFSINCLIPWIFPSWVAVAEYFFSIIRSFHPLQLVFEIGCCFTNGEILFCSFYLNLWRQIHCQLYLQSLWW